MPKYYEEHSNEDALKALKKQVECWEQGKPFEYHLQPLKTAIKALEKQIPKVIEEQTEDDREFIDFVCPNCKTTLQQKMKQAKRTTIYKYKHCIECGQVLDWGISND